MDYEDGVAEFTGMGDGDEEDDWESLASMFGMADGWRRHGRTAKRNN